jgi:hypothetical protein
MKQRFSAAGAIAALAILATGCSTLEVNTDYAPGTDFAKYKTFTIKHGSAPKNSIAVERIELSLANALTARGLRQVPEGGDLVMVSHLSLGKDVQLNSYGYGGWGGWRYGGGMQTTSVTEIPTGTLVVDLVDAKSSTAVWRGMAKDQISKTATPEDRQKKADDVARELFSNFPPGSKK